MEQVSEMLIACIQLFMLLLAYNDWLLRHSIHHNPACHSSWL
jgi:hypothetical protein